MGGEYLISTKLMENLNTEKWISYINNWQEIESNAYAINIYLINT